MIIDLRAKSSNEILECFEALQVDGGEVFEVEILESDIESIGYKSFVDLSQLYFMRLLTPIKKMIRLLF